MLSRSRRRFLGAVSITSIVGGAGCIGLGGGHPQLNPASCQAQDTSHALDDETVYLAVGDSNLPTSSTTTESVEDATAVLAPATADRTLLTRAFRAGILVAINGATAAVRGLLNNVGADYLFGLKMARARPMSLLVADPRGETVERYTFSNRIE